jgi:hypothetical protein
MKIIAQTHQQHSIECLIQLMVQAQVHLQLVMLDMVQMVLSHFHDLDYWSFDDVQLTDHYSMMLMVELVLKMKMMEMMNFVSMVKLNLIQKNNKILLSIEIEMNLLID